MRFLFFALMLLTLLPLAGTTAEANECIASGGRRVERAIGRLSDNFNDVPSCLDCARQTKPLEKMVCRNRELKLMEILDTKAAVYARENATRALTDHAKPDCSFVWRELAACGDETCVCRKLKQNTNDSLGGLTPYDGPGN